MRTLQSCLLFGLACVLLLVGASACGKGARQLAVPEPSAIGQVSIETEQPTSTGEVAWPSALPVDKLQPWEEVDAQGFVIPVSYTHLTLPTN